MMHHFRPDSLTLDRLSDIGYNAVRGDRQHVQSVSDRD
jgi:hypothetical protein